MASMSVGIGAKHKASASVSTVKSKLVKGGVCALQDATIFYPFDPNTYLHTGVPSKYISK